MKNLSNAELNEYLQDYLSKNKNLLEGEDKDIIELINSQKIFKYIDENIKDEDLLKDSTDTVNEWDKFEVSYKLRLKLVLLLDKLREQGIYTPTHYILLGREDGFGFSGHTQLFNSYEEAVNYIPQLAKNFPHSGKLENLIILGV